LYRIIITNALSEFLNPENIIFEKTKRGYPVTWVASFFIPFFY
jgi:hypothetical protein